jgi:hypothetical protein
MSLNQDDIVKFPNRFNVEYIHKLIDLNNKALSKQRQMIMFQIKHNLHYFKNNYPTSNRMATCEIHGLNYNNLTIIHKELIERGFIVIYILMQIGDTFESKQLLYEDIDPRGDMPTKLIIILPTMEQYELNKQINSSPCDTNKECTN